VKISGTLLINPRTRDREWNTDETFAAGRAILRENDVEQRYSEARFEATTMLMSANELSAARRFSTRARILEPRFCDPENARRGERKEDDRSIDHPCRRCSGLVAFVSRGETIAATENHVR